VAAEKEDKTSQLKKFEGRVTEIHSGDSLSVEDNTTKK